MLTRDQWCVKYSGDKESEILLIDPSQSAKELDPTRAQTALSQPGIIIGRCGKAKTAGFLLGAMSDFTD